MSIMFRKDLSRVHDAMEGLVLSYMDRYQQVYKDYPFTVGTSAEQALAFIHDNMSYDIPCHALFFGHETELAVSLARSVFIPVDLTLESFTDYLSGLSEDQIRLILLRSLKYASQRDLGVDERMQLIRDERAFLDFLKQTSLSPAIKWEVMLFFQDVKPIMLAFIDLVKRYLPVYQQVLLQYQHEIEKFEMEVAAGVEAEGKTYLSKLFRDSIELASEDITVGILFFRSRNLTCVTHDGSLRIFIGIHYEETVRQMMGGDDAALMILKNISDKTRFMILSLLKNGDLYGQEIAEKVGITLATVSYHMNFLLAANLVRLEKIGQKGYYTLKKDALRRCITFLKRTFDLSDDKEISDYEL